jgi:hypothetical protein
MATPATPVSDVDEKATIVVATAGSTTFSPLHPMYTSSKIAGTILIGLMMDFVTSHAL